jgi:hypothetical protein
MVGIIVFCIYTSIWFQARVLSIKRKTLFNRGNFISVSSPLPYISYGTHLRKIAKVFVFKDPARASLSFVMTMKSRVHQFLKEKPLPTLLQLNKDGKLLPTSFQI